eukprot:CAMPEP_0117427996 /NCGR_PEP_ID=MMETSP0758-20121206/7778_1 /TAXON_ID=63605 /ORGANISM="Percolomonas cosmopolitus, Strain AE-1 (ATCC 50343)" /LENGTH=63 /DNA_ID=CAMNT_0005214059 /DNA_START=74 /DNA_END=265 /DNA_ORIENTATION=+
MRWYYREQMIEHFKTHANAYAQEVDIAMERGIEMRNFIISKYSINLPLIDRNMQPIDEEDDLF